MVGRLLGAVTLAVGELVRLCTRSKSDAVRLSASREILASWLNVSRHVYVKGWVNSLHERVDRLEARRGEWQPTSPFRQVPKKK
jgi:hypothetical protein